MKAMRFGKLALLLAMIVASVFLLTGVSLAGVLLVAPSTINLGSVRPGDRVEAKKRLLIKFSKDIDLEEVTVTRVEDEGFILELEGKDGVEIPASYSCKEVFRNEEAGTIHVEVTIKVNEIEWEYHAGKYTGEITITFSEMP